MARTSKKVEALLFWNRCIVLECHQGGAFEVGELLAKAIILSHQTERDTMAAKLAKT